MPNYKESNVAGTKYTRCNYVSVQNKLNSTPYINFAEQEVVVLGDGEHMVKGAGEVGSALTPENIATSFDLLNPETGDVIGTSTYQQVYVLLHSLYLHLAAERDAAQAPV